MRVHDSVNKQSAIYIKLISCINFNDNVMDRSDFRVCAYRIHRIYAEDVHSYAVLYVWPSAN